MRFRLGLLAGFASGYYLGAKAGHARYQQLHRALGRVTHSDTIEAVAGKARDAVTTVAERARVAAHLEPQHTNGNGHASVDGMPLRATAVPPATPLTGEPTIVPPPGS